MSQVNDPNDFSANPVLDKSHLKETMGVADPECVVCMRVHFGTNIATGEPVFGDIRITEEEVEEHRGEAFLTLLMAKLQYLKQSLDAYARSQTN